MMITDPVEKAKEVAPQPQEAVKAEEGDFTRGERQGRIETRLDMHENYFATKTDLDRLQNIILGAVITVLLVFLSVSAGVNVALFRMLAGFIVDAFTNAVYQPSPSDFHPPPY